MSFQLLFDRTQRVLVARLGGELTRAALTEMRAAAKRFVAAEGQCRAILDLSAIERATVPGHFIADLARNGPIVVSEMRVLVAPRPELFGLSRMYELHQYQTADNTLVVHSFAEALAALGVADLNLEPVASG